MTVSNRRRAVDEVIFADEIGNQYGVHGDWRLRSAYQPIYAIEGEFLQPVAVEALLDTQTKGATISPAVFFEDMGQSERVHIESVARELHLRNFHTVDHENLDLFINYDPSTTVNLDSALEEISVGMTRLDEWGLRADQLVCEVTEQFAHDDAILLALVHEMRRHGLRIAIDDFGAGASTEHRLELIEPDIVKIDGAWFGELCRYRAAERLFRPLVSLLHDRSAKVLVEGIEEPQQLKVALDGGVDLLQGFLLARPALGGTIFNDRPLVWQALLQPGVNVVPLFG
jgi:EAL domain-containing protein (putative c-di-GMP-specific phosphodiesterase class I)